MKNTNTPSEFSEILREQLKMNTQDFHDLFSNGKNIVSAKPQLKHELSRAKAYLEMGRIHSLNILI